MKDIETVLDLISFQAKNFNNPTVLNFKENGQFLSFSNQTFLDKAFYFACGLCELGFVKGSTMANFSYQNPIWLIADFGALLAGGITVPIFNNISTENLQHEIADSNVAYVFTDEEDFLTHAASLTVQTITYGFAKEGVISFDDVIALGEKAALDQKYQLASFLEAVKADDLATIIYTSGSTGKPKGVELTHRNLISQIKATQRCFPLKGHDVTLSFLPLAHIFERMVMMYYLTQGISIFFADDVKNLGALLKEIRPSFMTVVPRVLEKVFLGIRDGVNDARGIKGILAKKALKRALHKDPESKKNLLDYLYDALIYKKFRQALGGNIRMIVCGGAALSEDLELFYKNIGLTIFCGYGLTEASPVLAANSPLASKIGTVGKAFPGVTLKIAPDGELWGKGEGIMRGYHNLKEETAKVLEDGWLKTGDLAQIDANGFIRIVGRKKELFKSANGKYVCPVPIEQKLVQQLGFLTGAVVVAEGRKFTSALLFPDFEALQKLKARKGFSGLDEDFLQSQELLGFVQSTIDEINKDADHWEQVQKFFIDLKAISIESGEITPSMKLKRSVLEERNRGVIDAFYQD